MYDKRVITCPDCGATSEETINSMFSGPESAIREHGTWAECKKCEAHFPLVKDEEEVKNHE